MPLVCGCKEEQSTQCLGTGFPFQKHVCTFLYVTVSDLSSVQFLPQLLEIPGPATHRLTPCTAREGSELAPPGCPGGHIPEVNK